jgi:ribonuclease E
MLILIDSCFGLVRTAIAERTHLLDYYEESLDLGRAKGNIYRGVVKRVDGNIQAAFIRYAGGRDGFLPLRDAEAVSAVGGTLRVGDPVLVQVVKDEVGEKGAALTVKLSLSGRYLVLVPGRSGDNGISSRVSDDERANLKRILGEMRLPEHASVILRTAALNQNRDDLQADLDRLSAVYEKLMEEFNHGKEPALLFREATPALRYLREYYSPEVSRIWVNDPEIFEQCRSFFSIYEEKSIAKVVLSKDGPLMFQKLGLETEVAQLTLRKVVLPSGANFVIDETEALVAIDVNSAKVGGRSEDSHRNSGLEATAFQVNKEAAVAICLQLRLRDLGGIIVIDFIDMEDERHRRQIEDLVRRSVSVDKAKIKVYDISPLGTMQISRQRIRKVGPNFSRQPCETCEGKGWRPHPAVGAFNVLRRIEERLLFRKSIGDIRVTVPYPVANELLNDFRDHILAMEKRFACGIRISAQASQVGEAIFETPAFDAENDRHRDRAPRNKEVIENHRDNHNRPKENGGRNSRSRRNSRFGGDSNRQSNHGKINPGPMSGNPSETPVTPLPQKIWVPQERDTQFQNAVPGDRLPPIPDLVIVTPKLPNTEVPQANKIIVGSSQEKPAKPAMPKVNPSPKPKPIKKRVPAVEPTQSKVKPAKSRLVATKPKKASKVAKVAKPLKPTAKINAKASRR